MERTILALALLNSSSANQPMHIRYLHCLNCLQRFLWQVRAPNGPQITVTAVCLRLPRGTKQRIMERPSVLPSEPVSFQAPTGRELGQEQQDLALTWFCLHVKS